MIDDNDWIKDVRKRNHELSNAVMRLEGQMLADRMVNEERHRATESQNRDIKKDLTELSRTVTNTATAVGEVSQDLRLILARMDSDEKTRKTTAEALALADQTRRERSNETWSWPSRIMAAVLFLIAVATYIQQTG